MTDALRRASLYRREACDARDDNCDSLAQAWYAKAWAAYEQAGDWSNAAEIICGLASLLDEEADQTQIQALYQQALALYTRAGNLAGQAAVHLRRADAALNMDDAVVSSAYEQAITLYAALNDQRSQLDAILRLCKDILSVQEESYGAWLLRALHLSQQIGDRHSEAECYVLMGRGCEYRHDKQPIAAHANYREALRLYASIAAHADALTTLQTLIRLCRDVTTDYTAYQAERASYRAAIQHHLSYIKSPKYWRIIIHLDWEGLAERAIAAGDVSAARYAWQQAAVEQAGFAPMPFNVGEVYWRWGQMEYQARNRAMGLAICRWGLALTRQDPDVAGVIACYEAEIERMEAAAHAP